MMTTTQSRPYVAFSLISRLGILDAVFMVDSLWAVHAATSTGEPLRTDWQALSLLTLTWLNVLLSVKQMLPAGAALTAEHVPSVLNVECQCVPKYEGAAKVMFLASVLSPVGGVKVMERKKETSLVPIVLRDSLKIDTHTVRDWVLVTEDD